MKFLVLALCVYSASAAVPGFGGYNQPWGAVAQAVAQVGAPVVKAVVQPVELTRTVLNGQKEAEAPILNYESDVSADRFNYNYATGNGISAASTGTLKNVDNTNVLEIQGQYSYTAPDGTPVQVTYTADENGFQPKGNLLPVAPPVPEAILRALKYISEQPKWTETAKNF